MNGTQIINTVVAYSTPELDEAKSKMAQMLDKMIAYIPTLKGQGMSNEDIEVAADQMIRPYAKKTFNSTGYMVDRNGQTAILSIGRETVNEMINLFNRQIK